MTTRTNIYNFLGAVFFILTWLFVGLYRDGEFYESNVFVKYRPTFKVYFYDPIGMSDMTDKDLSAEKQLEEIAFQEFVIQHHFRNNNNAQLWYLPFITMQLTLSFFSFGILKSRRNLGYKIWHLPAHFAVCLILTSTGLGFILHFGDLISLIIGGLLILMINYWTLVLLTKHRNRKKEN